MDTTTPIRLTKTNPAFSLRKDTPVTARVSWPAKTDYDLGAEILYKDGTTESIATFPTVKANAFGDKIVLTPDTLTSRNGTVQHSGDAQRGAGTSTETITVRPDAEIAEVTFWAYSAQSNSTGSFRRYAVTMSVTDGTNTVQIDARDASSDDRVYTCVPGKVVFTESGPTVEYLEKYSRPGSEYRPQYRLTGGLLRKAMGFTVDGSERNDYK